MAYSINHEELLNKIQRDPDAAVAKQLLIPANTTCAIIFKRMLGIFDRQDQLQLSAETLSAIKYLAEHDYLAYLVFLERFDLIREIFWQKELFAQQLALIDEIEKEKEAEKNQQLLLSEQEQLSLLTRRQQEQLVREREQRFQEERALINMDLYRYYTQLEQEIHSDFHLKQIDILNNAYKGRIERINRAVIIVENDPSVALEDKEALTKLHHDYKEEYEEVQRMPIHKPDSSIDPVALRKKVEAAKRVDDKFKHQLGAILRKYPEHEQLAQIYREESDAIHAYEGKLTRNEEEHEQQLAEIRPHLEETRRIAKDDLEQSMSTSVDCLKQCDLKGLSDDTQRNAFNNSIKNLKGHRLQLSQTDDHARVRELTNQFAAELVRINEMVKPSMLPPDVYQKLQREVRVLSELNTRINTEPAVLSTFQVHASEQLPTYAQTVQNDPQPPSYREAIGEPPFYDDLTHQDPTSFDETQRDQFTAHHTTRYRGHM
ncbi:hypothetical protein, partial [Legionella sp.]|uniref:hypothetical protein n=1 Tax=Legionella sp. TaxID=459 RepID=UPI003CA5B6E6